MPYRRIKGNASLEFSAITGILRVAKEGIFSGLNNLFVCPITSEFFDADFGFSEQEVVAMLDYYGLDYNLDEVRSWYDGYTIGKQQHVYNPWSITSFVKNNGKIAPYWVNTSENLLIQDLIKTAGPETKIILKVLSWEVCSKGNHRWPRISRIKHAAARRLESAFGEWLPII